MQDKPSIDPGILVPAILGILSLAGIAVIFFIGRQNDIRPAGELPSTNTPFRYVYLGTEPGLSTFTAVPTETQIFAEPGLTRGPSPEDESPLVTSTPPTNAGFPTQPSVRTPLSTSTASATATISAVLAKYDDTYFQILYDGEWTAQTNVTDAYQNTLHISFTIENFAEFTFVGQQIIIGYQAGPSLGEILIDIDGFSFQVSQSNSRTQLLDWRSPILVMGTHTIIIEHFSGGSVNIDSITIPDLTTPTPTPTETP
jgi:hypothetical protein